MTQAGTGGAAVDRGFVDLHMHSTASDGALPPDAVVAAAKAARLAAIALTDHDTLEGIASASAAGSRLGVRVVAGVELSAEHAGREVHILGLHLSRVSELESRLAIFRATRRERARRIVEELNRLGVPVTIEAVLAIAGAGAIGRPHVARALIAGGWAADHREAFDRYLGAGRPAFVPKHRLAVEEAIRLVHAAGGLAVLAHPGSDTPLAQVEQLAALGLDGMEVRHPSHTPDDAARLLAACERLDLVPSGGSDWHGASAGARSIGAMHVPHAWLDGQEARVTERRAREHVA